MLNIRIICVGKIKETSLKELCNEYLKRISKYSKIEMIELDDDKIPNNASPSIEEQIKSNESRRIIEKIQKFPQAHVILLDLKGKQLDSIEFSDELNNIATYSSSTIIFVIGGSLGMSQELLNLYNNKLCFSKMTFPHQLIRIFLLEQIFRAFKIINNETYHK